MPQAIIGTSGWAYPTWKPDFYPEKLASKKFLSHYAGVLSGVEVNYTFRRFLPEKTQLGWIESTPAGFRFAIKAHQAITHFKRLRGAEGLAGDFARSLAPLASAGRLGPILFQLPPQMKADAALLADFAKALPKARELRYTFEFRDVSWFAEPTYEALRAANAALCWAESEERDTPHVDTADFRYYRLRKPEYSKAELAALEKELAAHVALGRDAFVFFKHEDTPAGALMAREVLQQLQAKSAAGKSYDHRPAGP